MKTKLTPLALLIPAVVLAQPAPQVPAPQPPQNQRIPRIITEQNALTNPAGIDKAAAAQALSKARSRQSSGEVGGFYYRTTAGGGRFFCSSEAQYCTNTQSS